MKTALIIGLAAIGTGAMAQTTPPATAAPDANTVVVSRALSIEKAVAAMGKAAGATVVVDPAITGNVTAAVAKLPLEQGLTTIAAENHVQWRRAYLKENEIPHKADGTVDAAKVRQIVEAASAVPNVSVGVFDPTTGMVAMTTRTSATAPATQDWIKVRQPVYVLYRPTGTAGQPGADPVADYLATQKSTMESFKNMTPEQRGDAMKQGIEMFLNMDPNTMGDMMKQQMQAFQTLSPETKAKLMDMSMKMMSGAAGGSGGGNGQ